MEERRQFTRIVFSTPAHISHMGRVWPTKLIDLSLKGALVDKPDDWVENEVKTVLLTFTLGDSEVELHMNMQVSHEEDNQLGLVCEQIDIDSVTHLKRLIELNVGNDTLLHRELDNLAHPDSE